VLPLSADRGPGPIAAGDVLAATMRHMARLFDDNELRGVPRDA
jgi:hypothetical protein